ncbi:MAG: ParB/RepB/Spo0J family partition protein [Clostridiales bacterium]|nr:ParB/RepB/Spo0J family partition protein [Clostridiales bacterium]
MCRFRTKEDMGMSILQEGNKTGGRQICWLEMESIFPNPQQPRKEFNDFALMELASSIRQYGLLQPITVREKGEGYEIIMGERRYRACQMLGFTHIDAFIQPATDGESALMAVIENIQRENLHFFEEAEAYAELIGQGISQETLARRLGKSPSGVANKLRLLKLDKELRNYLFEEGLSERHARALLPLPDANARMRIARQAAENHLTVRETEMLVQKAQKRLPVPPPRRRVISLVRDPRLYVNAIKSVVAQMKETGMDTQMDIRETEGWMEMRIRFPQKSEK